MRLFSHRCAITASTLAAVCGMALPAAATNLSWLTATSGLASAPGSWSPAQVPTALDSLFFQIPGTYTVTYNALSSASFRHSYDAGSVTLNCQSPHTIGGAGFFAGSGGGTVELTLASGTLNCNGEFNVGHGSSTRGSLNLVGATSRLNIPTRQITVGNSGEGLLVITDGAAASAETFGLGRRAGSTGHAVIQATSTTPTTLTTTGPLPSRIGDLGQGTLEVLNGGRVIAAGPIAIAADSAASGTMRIGSGVPARTSSLTASSLTVGNNTTTDAAGAATAIISTGGSVSINGTTTVGDVDGGTAELVVTGGEFQTQSLSIIAPGTLTHSGGQITINGGTFTPPAGAFIVAGLDHPTMNIVGGANISFGGLTLGHLDMPGTFIVRDDAIATLTGPSLIKGELVVSEARLISTGTINVQTEGTLTISDGGFISAPTINISNTTLFSSGGEIRGIVRFPSGSTHINITGNTTLGDPTLSGSVVNVGQLELTAARLTFLSLSETSVGQIATMSAGTIEAPSGMRVVSTGQLTGNGTLIGPVSHRGIMTATGSGITVNGTLAGPWTTMNGTRYTFTNNCTFSGLGDINASVTLLAGSSFSATTGTLSMGATSGLSQVDISGTVNANARTVILRDGDTALVHTGGLVTLNGGTIDPTNTLQLENNGRLTGFGTIAGNLTNNGGIMTVTPNANPLLINGLLRCFSEDPFSGGTINVSATPSAHSSITCTLPADLGGTINFTIDPALSIRFGDSFEVFRGPYNGTFSTVTNPDNFAIEYGEESISFVYLPCPADFNLDGGIDGDDIGAFFTDWEAGDLHADVNRDGGVDGDDVSLFFTVWENGGCRRR
jgi:T5SS/PEP-CTERM-associated repeat protein